MRAHLRIVLLAFAVLLVPAAPAGAAGRDAWEQAAKPSSTSSARPPAVRADRFRALRLDREVLARVLARARPAEALVLALPAPDGSFQRFEVRPYRMMAPALAAQHPGIATYRGHALAAPATSVHLDLGPAGFHASVRGPGGTWYIDPYLQRSERVYAAYRAEDLEEPPHFDKRAPLGAPAPKARLAGHPFAADGSPVTLRRYRLALLTDPAYANHHGAGNVVAAKVALVNRVNQVYEDDFAVRLELVAGDLELNTPAEMTGPDGPCGAAPCFTAAQAGSCEEATLDQTRIVLGQLAGADRFDVGHLALGVNGGGLAYLRAVGGDDKAGGCTGFPTPVGDAFAVDYVAHELGHQFGGNHTFNGCDGNRNGGTSVEPGSGSSVMAYAGICGANNLQAHSDPYFSQRSLQEMGAFINSSQPAVQEVQTVSLRGFDGADSFTMTFGGNRSAPITRGTNYTAAGIRAAVEPILGGRTVTVAGFGGGTLTDAGFQLTFAGTTDVPALELTTPSGASGFVGTTAQGGPAANGGHIVAVTSNESPVVTAPAARTIPTRTPFTLTGAASDADGDALTYSWEQNDIGTTETLLRAQVKTNGPLFRQFSTAANVTNPLVSPAPGHNAASTSPTRTFPDMAQVLAGDTNAATGSCPASSVECFSEFLPTAQYTAGRLNFRLTARDGRGGTGRADTQLTVATSAGPFRVTSQSSPATAAAGGPLPVTWNVAGTTGAAIGVSQVRVSLSRDGGATFPHVLAEATPNDGSQTVTLPAQTTSQGRIRVEAVGNYFFDVSRANLTIADTPAPVVSADAPPSGATVQYTDALATPVTVTAFDSDTAGSALNATASGLPPGMALTQGATEPKQRQWTVTGATTAAPGSYPVTVTVTDGTHEGSTTFAIDVRPEDVVATYTGATTADAGSGEQAAVGLAARLQEPADGTPGDLGLAQVTFVRDATTLCSAPATPAPGEPGAATAACEGALPPGASTVLVAAGGRYTGTATAAVTVSGGPSPQPTATATPEPTATPTPEPAAAVLAPDLRAVARRLAVSRRGRVVIRVRCRAATAGVVPKRCRGAVALAARIAGRSRRIGSARFDLAPGRTARVRVKLTSRGRRALRRGLRATVAVAVANPGREPVTATKRVRLRR